MNAEPIDCQVHAYERDHPGRPWQGFLHGPAEVTGDDMVAAMDAVGVAGALLVSPFSMYAYDASYALEVHAKHPGRFGLIKPFDPDSSAVGEEVTEWASRSGVVGARIMLANQEDGADLSGIKRILQAGADLAIPVNVLCWGRLSQLAQLAREHPDTQVVVDHLGIMQPFEPPAPKEPFRHLQEVVALAKLDNVAIKISGACTLSHEQFPFRDIWRPLGEIFEAFGLERCMWGTDWTRAVNLLNYEDGVNAFMMAEHLSASDRAMLMGGSLSKIYNWSPSVT
jgi:L-fuconolactonase